MYYAIIDIRDNSILTYNGFYNTVIPRLYTRFSSALNAMRLFRKTRVNDFQYYKVVKFELTYCDIDITKEELI